MNSSTEINAESQTSSSPPARTLSGNAVVVGMFIFAATLVGLMYLYWHLHHAPFVELQRKLDNAFPKSRPLVEGGRRKSKPENPLVLRVTMEVPFNPETDTQARDAWTDEVLDIIETEPQLPQYERLHLYLFWPEPEREIVQVRGDFPVINGSIGEPEPDAK